MSLVVFPVWKLKALIHVVVRQYRCGTPSQPQGVGPSVLTLSLKWCHLKSTNKSARLEICSLIFFHFFYIFFSFLTLRESPKRISVKTHSIESKFVIRRTSNLLLAGMYVYTFQPGNFTGWGSEGVNRAYCHSNKTKLKG